MRFMLAAILYIALFIQVAQAQALAAANDDRGISAWRTVLAPGALEGRPAVVPVESGFAIWADAFIDPPWSFNSDWVLYDPASDRWSSAVDPRKPSQLVNISNFVSLQPEMATMFPNAAEPGIQFVDGDRRAVFLADAGENLADHRRYLGVKHVDLETGLITKLNIWYCWGLLYSDAIVWEFPEENLIVSCDMLVWLDGDSIHTEWISDYIGQDRISMLDLLSTSPDNRYWILREHFYYDPWYGDVYLYDRQTGWITVLLWRDWGISYNIAAWTSDSTVIVNEGNYVMYFDTESYERRFALEDELSALADPQTRSRLNSNLSRDGQWLLVVTDTGGLVLRNVYAALGIGD